MPVNAVFKLERQLMMHSVLLSALYTTETLDVDSIWYIQCYFALGLILTCDITRFKTFFLNFFVLFCFLPELFELICECQR